MVPVDSEFDSRMDFYERKTMNVHDKNIAKLVQIVGILEEYWDDLTPEQIADVSSAWMPVMAGLIEGATVVDEADYPKRVDNTPQE